MNRKITRRSVMGLVSMMLGGLIALPGCGGSDNEQENALTAAPGIPSANPNESVAERRGRTRATSKQVEKIEQRNQGAAKKGAAKDAAAKENAS